MKYKRTVFAEMLRRRMKKQAVSEISAQLGVPRSTIRDWIRVADNAGLTYELIKTMTEDQFLASVNQQRQPTLRCYQPDWVGILDEVSSKKCSLQRCFEHYVASCPKASKPMGRSAFYAQYRKLKDALPPDDHRLYLHNSFEPASVTMIDYSGGTIAYCEPGDKTEHRAQVFVGVLGHSGLIYCHATLNQKRGAWLSSIADMFSAFGGVTEELWLDNSSPLVRKADRVEATLDPELVNLCEQYNTEARAVAPGEPTYKGLVENAVKQTQDFIIKEFVDRKFFSIDEINRAIQPELKKLNARTLREKPWTSRQKRFDEQEAPMLRSLPVVGYAPGLECFERKVLKGDQIRIENLRYNVPWGHVGKMLIVSVDRIKRTIEFRLKDSGKRIHTTTLRTQRQGDEPTRPELVPPELRLVAMNRADLLELIKSDSHFLQQAQAFAEHLAKQANSRASTHLRHLINVGRRLSSEALEEVCRRTLACAEVNIKTFDRERNAYASQTDRPKQSNQVNTDIVGANDVSETRGADYFKATKEENK